MKSLAQIKNTVSEVLRAHGIVRAGLFGSVVRGDFSQYSDIDVLIEPKETMSLFDYIKIKQELEALLNTKVDLVDYATIKSRLKDRILAEEVQLYG